jgi:hypothetical protein
VALPLSSYPYSPECLEEKFSEVHSVGASRIAVIIGREWWQGDLRRRDPRLHLDLAGALLHGQARVGDLRGAVDPDHPQPGTDPPGGRLRLLTLTQTLTPKPPPENRSSTRLASAVRVTLSTTLTTIQNRRPLPAQPLPPPPPPNTIMPDSSSGRWTGRLRPPGPLVSCMDPRSLWLIK